MKSNYLHCPKKLKAGLRKAAGRNSTTVCIHCGTKIYFKGTYDEERHEYIYEAPFNLNDTKHKCEIKVKVIHFKK